MTCTMSIRTFKHLPKCSYPIHSSALSYSSLKPRNEHLLFPEERSPMSIPAVDKPLIREHGLFKLDFPHLARKIQADILSTSLPSNSIIVEALEVLSVTKFATLKENEISEKCNYSPTSKLLGLSQHGQDSPLELGTKIVKHAGIQSPLALFSYLKIAKLFRSPRSVLVGLNLYSIQQSKYSSLTNSHVIPHNSAEIALETTSVAGDLEATEKVIDICYSSEAIRRYNLARALFTALIPVAGLLLAGKVISLVFIYRGIEPNQSMYLVLMGLGSWCTLCLFWFYIWFIVSRPRTGFIRFSEGTGILSRITNENERKAWEAAMNRRPNWKTSNVFHQMLNKHGFQYVKPELEFVPLTAKKN